MLTQEQKSAIDGLMLHGLSKNDFGLVIQSTDKMELQWLYQCLGDITRNRSFEETDELERGTDWHKKESESMERPVYSLGFMPSIEMTRRINTWETGVPNDATLDATVGRVLYALGGYENRCDEGEYIEFATDNISKKTDSAFKNLFREKGYDIEGHSGLFRLGVEDSEKFRELIGSSPVVVGEDSSD